MHHATFYVDLVKWSVVEGWYIQWYTRKNTPHGHFSLKPTFSFHTQPRPTNHDKKGSVTVIHSLFKYDTPTRHAHIYIPTHTPKQYKLQSHSRIINPVYVPTVSISPSPSQTKEFFTKAHDWRCCHGLKWTDWLPCEEFPHQIPFNHRHLDTFSS